MTTPNLNLENVPSNSLQPSVPINDAFQLLDALVQFAVVDKDAATPPATLASDVGKRWIVPANPTGAWVGHTTHIALCTAADQWRFIIPKDGFEAVVLDENLRYRFMAGAWVVAGAAGGTVTSVAVADATGISWTGSPITTSGTFTPTLSTNLQAWSGVDPASKANLAGAAFTGTVSTPLLIAGDGYGTESVRIGNDSSLWDVDTANTFGVKGAQDANQGFIQFGNGSQFGYNGSALVWGNTVIPSADNAYDVGSASLRPRQYYGANATISTSDARLKTAPRDMTDAEVSAFSAIARLPNVWQWIARVESEGDAARLHAGPTVQAAIAVMEANGLEWSEYAAFCYDEWGEEAEVSDPETGDVVQVYRPAGDRYSFRREELLALIVRAQAAQLDSLSARVAAIEAKLNP